MVSIKERITLLEAEAGEYKVEAEALRAANEELQADAAAVKAEYESAVQDFTAKLDAAHAEVEELKSNLEDAEENAEAIEAEAAELRKKVEITPAVQDVVDGQEPIADGSVQSDDRDVVAEMNAIEGSAERIAFYRQNKEEIDKAFSK